MQGLILNEDGYVTYPYDVFRPIKEYVVSLNWRITNVECGGDGSSYAFPFEQTNDYFIDGESLFNMLNDHPRMQWWWGALSGFNKDIPWDEIRKNPIIDISMKLPYLENEVHHLEPLAVFEVIAFDSSETYVLADDPAIVNRLCEAFPNAENLEKYVFDKD